MSRSSIDVAFPTDSDPIRFGVGDLREALEGVTMHNIADIEIGEVDVAVFSEASGGAPVDAVDPSSLKDGGYELASVDAEGHTVSVVSAPDDAGAMYGVLDLAERVRMGADYSAVEDRQSEPEVEFRAIKFNLPWSPYRGGDQTRIHHETCRDLDFWESFLDMMARNRFNALTLWNLHPFSYMVRVDDYPEACEFSDKEMADWQDFWHSLFEMAHQRGIETYVLNWNIVVSEGFADAYDVNQFNDRSDVVRDYTRQCVTETINEYPNLDGLGVSLCDWMSGMSPREKQEWFEQTFLDGIEQADRPVKLLDRSVLTESIEEMRQTIDRAAELENVSKIRVPTKFNWSHGHSSTSLELTHDYSSGEVDDSLWNPEPENYSIAWMIRNEDFFILRWGDPDFVREHLSENHADLPYVDGYFVGSEAFIPAKDYSHELSEHQTWQYMFEKRWLLYMVWGRLLYDPETSDEVFEVEFERRYGDGLGEELLNGYRSASKMPEELASFHQGTWDYALYSEGFLAPHRLGVDWHESDDEAESAFITINQLIEHDTLDSSYVSIREYVSDDYTGSDVMTPPELADRIEETGRRALNAADGLRTRVNDGDGALECEVDDIEAWGHLSLYFAEKLRAGVALETFRTGGSEDDRQRAVELLREARDQWDGVIGVTQRHYREVPYATDVWPEMTFSWARFRDQVERDIRIANQTQQYSE